MIIMKKLKIRPNTTEEEARNYSSLGLVYICPKCKVGHALVHFSLTAGTVECKLCGNKYAKP